MDTGLFYYIASIILALIPVVIWLSLIFNKTKHKGLQLLMFFAGTLTVLPILALQYIFNIFPQIDLGAILQNQIHNQNFLLILVFIGVGISEELVKQLIIRSIDRRYLLIQTIQESIQFSLVSALGFSLIENILYIYNIWTNVGIQQLFFAYLFRSIFTTCAHMIFSGIFGYYYGIAKFSFQIREQNKLTGKKKFLSELISQKFNISPAESLKQITILKGLGIAMLMHAIFDFLLQLNQIIPVVIFEGISAWILIYLYKKRAANLVLYNIYEAESDSNMNKTDEQVVLELIGMWFKEKKYVDVIHICERLLQRDPANKVVQLFKAEAIDKMDGNNIYSQILGKLFPKK